MVVRDYLALGLRLGRHIEGFVDCWFGDPELFRQVAAEPLTPPATLVGAAEELQARLPDSGLAPARQRFLAAQLTALECSARRLAGEEIPFKTEVASYFEVDIAIGSLDRYAAVHAEIDALLPGGGPLRDRVEAFYERNVVPPSLLLRAVRSVSDQLRARVRELYQLPASETVEYEVVSDKPWNAFNRYLGSYRSGVALNARAGRTIAALPLMVTHEAYPGHHTDHCVKEAQLVLGRGEEEHAIALVNTPQCLVAEGMAELGDSVVLAAGWGPWTASLLAEVGVRIDGELVERMLPLVRHLLPVRQDAAILLHDRGATADEAVEYVQRWLLLPQDRAEQMVRFLTDPLWRAYSTTYIEGSRLVGEWLAAGPDVRSRYQSLLTEQYLPSDLVV